MLQNLQYGNNTLKINHGQIWRYCWIKSIYWNYRPILEALSSKINGWFMANQKLMVVILKPVTIIVLSIAIVWSDTTVYNFNSRFFFTTHSRERLKSHNNNGFIPVTKLTQLQLHGKLWFRQKMWDYFKNPVQPVHIWIFMLFPEALSWLYVVPGHVPSLSLTFATQKSKWT